jgi:hypothetical protein
VSTLAEGFFSRFGGHERAHGIYKIPSHAVAMGSKVEGTAQTVRRPLTTKDWERHLKATTASV